MVKRRNIGDMKRLYERTKSYIVSLNFLMVGYLFIKESEIAGWIVILTLAPILILVAWFDATYVHGKELKSGMDKNPDWVELCKRVKKIEENL